MPICPGGSCENHETAAATLSAVRSRGLGLTTHAGSDVSTTHMVSLAGSAQATVPVKIHMQHRGGHLALSGGASQHFGRLVQATLHNAASSSVSNETANPPGIMVRRFMG